MARLSVIVPVFSQPELLSECLRSIRGSIFTDYELLVSDDHSPEADAIEQVAAQYGARLLRADARKGSAAARNSGARVACGDQLVFIDSDVTVRPDTLACFAQTFDGDPLLDAVIGSYDREPAARGIISQFRNLLHAHAHQTSRPEATTFWTGCGAVRRQRFLAMGGFDESFTRPSIEDVEFGLRLHRAGGRILLAREIQVTHHKAWGLYSMARTDLFARAIPWAGLLREHGLPRDLNFQIRDRFGVGLTALAALVAVIALRHGLLYWGLFAVLLAAIAVAHASLLRFLAASRGAVFAAASFPLLLVYNLTCAVGLAVGLFRAECRRDRWLLPGLLGCAALIFGLQTAGGAYRAEFDAYPDEAAHFVSGLMVYDYLEALPRENPVTWAKHYYVHYPKVAIGHWPPGFPVMEAAWWLVFVPSRWSSMLLNAAMMLLAAGIFYHLLRDLAPPWVALSAAALLILAPAVQQSYTQSMADLPCLLWSVLLTDSMVRLARRPSFASACLVGLWLTCALLTKGSGVCLVLAPLLALSISGQWRRLELRWIVWVAAAVVILGFGWYLFQGLILHENLRSLGGAYPRSHWKLDLIPGLTGYGFFALALAGAVIAFRFGRAASIASLSVLISTLAMSFVARSMNESRHFIIVIPAVLLLAVQFLTWVRTYTRYAIFLAIPAVAFFPFTITAQPPAGFASLLHRIHRPARMLVSSNGSGEGAWIAEAALTEKRPTSIIARASKTLATSGWNGENYRLLATTTEEIHARLDEVAIETVVVHSDRTQPVARHQVLLEEALKNSETWRWCGGDETSTVYCRIKPPSVARRRLRIDLTDKIGRFVEEP